jgi:hypothetical protein
MVILISVLGGCDQGLTPPEQESLSIEFPVLPDGGNPVGYWTPDPVCPVDAIILKELPVDSLGIHIGLNGDFEFYSDFRCNILAEMDLDITVYLPIEPFVVSIPTIYDTLRCDGPYDIVNETVLTMPLESAHFNLDTLGITADVNTMDLISPPIEFDYMGIMTVHLAFIFHLNRSSEILSKSMADLIIKQREEDIP